MEIDSRASPITKFCDDIEAFYTYVRYIRLRVTGTEDFVAAITTNSDRRLPFVKAFMNLASSYSRLASNRKDVLDQLASMYSR
jgi:hypothetical protein